MDPRMPRAVFAFGVFMLLGDLYIAYGAVFDPADYSPDPVANARTQMMWAGRVVGMFVVLAAAVLARSAPLLATAMGMRATAEAFDAVAFLRAGSSTGYVVLVVVALELTAMIWLLIRILAAGGVTAGPGHRAVA